jgi:ABC-type nitrate/sulfonate/bicarbonate transport system ATPase subunit
MSRIGCRLRVDAKSFGATPVIDGVTLDLRPGTLTALVGPSGAGKTTLLNILAGLDRDFAGDINWDGGRSGRVGYCFQEPRLMPWLSLRRNLELVVADADAAGAHIDHLLERVGLAERADALPAELSGGMQRRAALARAMAVRPSLLLLDEPFASLDAPTAAGLRRLVLELWREQGNATLLVTHHLREALELADSVVFLDRGPARVVLREVLSPSRRDPAATRDPAALEADLLARHPEILSGIAAGVLP